MKQQARDQIEFELNLNIWVLKRFERTHNPGSES